MFWILMSALRHSFWQCLPNGRCEILQPYVEKARVICHKGYVRLNLDGFLQDCPPCSLCKPDLHDELVLNYFYYYSMGWVLYNKTDFVHYFVEYLHFCAEVCFNRLLFPMLQIQEIQTANSENSNCAFWKLDCKFREFSCKLSETGPQIQKIQTADSECPIANFKKFDRTFS